MVLLPSSLTLSVQLPSPFAGEGNSTRDTGTRSGPVRKAGDDSANEGVVAGIALCISLSVKDHGDLWPGLRHWLFPLYSSGQCRNGRRKSAIMLTVGAIIASLCSHSQGTD
jgi:hypothetical protein